MRADGVRDRLGVDLLVPAVPAGGAARRRCSTRSASSCWKSASRSAWAASSPTACASRCRASSSRATPSSRAWAAARSRARRCGSCSRTPARDELEQVTFLDLNADVVEPRARARGAARGAAGRRPRRSCGGSAPSARGSAEGAAADHATLRCSRSSSTRPARSPSATGCSPRTSARCRRTCERTNSLNSGPSRLPGLRRGARRALRDRRRDARDRQPADRGQRDRLPRSVLDAVSRDVVADPVDPLAVRQRRRGRLGRRRGACACKGRSDVRVIAQGGDGGTTDIGFGCLSGMFERNDDVLYICYDNEAYMNTGVQRSSATPPAARTATTPAVGPRAGQRLRHRQERAADRDGAQHSLRRDGERRQPARPRVQGDARDGHPRRALHPHPRALPARLGLGAGRHDQGRAPRGRVRALSAVRGRARRGHRAHADPPPGAGRRVPASCRSASRTCSARSRDEARLAQIQAIADRNIATLRPARPRGAARGQAVRHHARRRLEPRQQDRLVAHVAPGLRRPAAAVQPRLPGRREHPGLALPRRRRRLRGRVARADRRTIRCPRSWAASATTRARPPATAAARRGGRHQLGRALPRRRGDQARLEVRAADAGDRASACSSSAPGRRACRRPTTCAGSATR